MRTASADQIKIESDEHGFELHVWIDDGELVAWSDGRVVINVHGVAEELYDAVKGSIGPYLQERDAARASMPLRGLTDAEREEEERCAALGMEGPNHKTWMHERYGQ